jgi:N-acyl-D-amino-acid deacylase
MWQLHRSPICFGFFLLLTGVFMGVPHAPYSQPSLESVYGIELSKHQEPVTYLIINATIYRGNPPVPYQGNIGITNDEITYIGNASPPRKILINADGAIVTPGFIDGHTHVDQGLRTSWNPEQYICQGYTTVIGGNCGTSPLNIPQHLEKVAPLGINYGLFVGHNSLRRHVMGYANRAPTQRELNRMKELLKRGINAGAMGLSSGLAYRPGAYASSDELISLLRSVKEFKPIYTTHIRSERERLVQAVEEGLEIGSQAEVRVNISHLKCFGEENRGTSEAILTMMAEYRNAGTEVYGDVYPFHASGSYLHFLIPSRMRSYIRTTNRHRRTQLRTYLLNEIAERGGTEGIYIGASQANSQWVGKNIQQVVDALEVSPEDAVIALLRQDYYTAATFQSIIQEDMERFIQADYVGIISDSALGFFNHPRATSVASTIFQTYVLRKRMLTLEQAIYKMACLPAEIYGLSNRGVIEVGKKADLAIFDPRELRTHASYAHPEYLTTGMRYVFMNGVLVYRWGTYLHRYEGVFVRPYWNDSADEHADSTS